jgi:nicotinamidase-related amidase
MPHASSRPPKNADLHGNVPDKSPIAVVVIDVINDLEFEGGEDLEEPALAMAHQLAPLLARARDAEIPVIYANDNFGRWRSDFQAQIDHCLGSDVRGREIARLLRPGKDDYFVLKPKHSAFFATAFDTLLAYLGARTLVLTGIATDSCILATAIDADMRDLKVVVPDDCVAALSKERHERALDHLRETLDVRTVKGADVDFEALASEPEADDSATSRAPDRATRS